MAEEGKEEGDLSLFLICPNDQNVTLGGFYPTSTVAQLKESIETTLGVPCDQQALFLVLGEELIDQSTFAACGITKWSSVYLVLRLDGAGALVIFIEIFYKSAKKGRMVMLETNVSDDIETVQRLIEQQHNIPCEHQSLYFGRKMMDLESSLGDCHVRYFSTVKCVVEGHESKQSSSRARLNVLASPTSAATALNKPHSLAPLTSPLNKKDRSTSWKICVRTQTGAVHLTVEPTTTIAMVKKDLTEQFGVDGSQQSLFLKIGEELNDHQTCADVGLKHNGSLYLFIKLTGMGMLTVFVEILFEHSNKAVLRQDKNVYISTDVDVKLHHLQRQITTVEMNVGETALELKRAVAREEDLMPLSRLILQVHHDVTATSPAEWRVLPDDTPLHTLQLQFFSRFRILVFPKQLVA